MSPFSKKSEYEHNRQEPPSRFDQDTFKDVPLSHTNYHGEKYDIPGARAIVGKEKETGRWKIQSILTPRHPKEKKEKKPSGEKKERGFLRWLKDRKGEEHAARKKYKAGEKKYPQIAKDLKEIGGDEGDHEQKFDVIIDKAERDKIHRV
jgi:hypothetical protein